MLRGKSVLLSLVPLNPTVKAFELPTDFFTFLSFGFQILFCYYGGILANGSRLCSNIPARTNKLALKNAGMTWENMVVEEVVDDRYLLTEMTPELRTLYVIVYTILPNYRLAVQFNKLIHNDTNDF